MMIWVRFPSHNAFDDWHTKVKTALGLPKPSVDAEGNIDVDAVINTDYVIPFEVAQNDIRALIDEKFKGDLEISEKPPSSYDA